MPWFFDIYIILISKKLYSFDDCCYFFLSFFIGIIYIHYLLLIVNCVLNFCTYHKAPFPLVYCQWFAESILIQYDVNLQFVIVVTSTAIVRIGHLVLEIDDDNAPKALPIQ